MKRARTLAELELNLTGFDRFAAAENSSHIYYSNDNKGISVGVNRIDNTIFSVELFPSSSGRSLRCPEAAKREFDLSSVRRAARKPDLVLSEINPSALTDLGKLVQLRGPSKLIIIVYAGHCLTREAAIANASRARDLLTKSGDVPVDIVFGGYRLDQELEFYIQPDKTPLPVLVPTVHPGDHRENCNQKSKLRRFK
jgi:hypothetical protein